MDAATASTRRVYRRCEAVGNKLELIIPPPLKQMFQSCAVFCEPACCGLDAFDVDAL